MRRFAAEGHPVLYVETQVHWVTYFRLLRLRWRRATAFLHGPREVEPNLWVYTLPIALPFFQMWRPLCHINAWMMTHALRAAMRKIDMRDPVVYSYAPYAAPIVRRLRPAKVVYECVDEFAAAKGLVRPAVVRALEQDMLAQADVTIVTAPKLYDSKRALCQRTHLIPNAAEVERFNPIARGEVPSHAVYRGIPGPRIGFVGALAYWIDLDLIAFLAERRPNYQFVFIGPVSVSIGSLKQFKNIHWLDRRPYDELPALVAGLDVCLNPYRVVGVAEACSPLKLYEYLASGKPIVSTRMPEAEKFADIVMIADSYEEALAHVDSVLSSPLDNLAEIRKRSCDLSQSHSWDARFQATRVALKDILGEIESPAVENGFSGIRIGIKATHITPGGGQAHLVNLLRHAPESINPRQIVIFASSSQRGWIETLLPGSEIRYSRMAAWGGTFRILWEQFVLPWLVRGASVDVAFEPGNLGMLWCPRPRVALLHNIAPFATEYIATESFYQRLRLRALGWLTALTFRRAAGVIFPSEFCRNTFGGRLLGANGRVCVIPHGADNPVGPLRSYKGEPFLFCCSHIYRYKGLETIIEAFAEVSRFRTGPLSLIIAGEIYDREYRKRLMTLAAQLQVEERIRFIGSVDQQTLWELYGACELFVFPSLIESISITLIEALKSGAAILASDTGVMPEVLGDAGTLVAPSVPGAWACAITKYLDDSEARRELRRKARVRGNDFDWRRMAQDTFEFLMLVAKQERKQAIMTPKRSEPKPLTYRPRPRQGRPATRTTADTVTKG